MSTYAKCSGCSRADTCVRVFALTLCRECVRAFVALWAREGGK